MWKKLFKDSSRDHGTLGQFCSLLGRHPSAKDPKKDMNACSDFLMTVLNGHYIAAACNSLGLETPESDIVNVPNPKTTSLQERRAFVYDIAKSVVEQCGLLEDALLLKDIPNPRDGIYNYTRVLCHLSSVALEFKDAWSEGDADRICRCWKIFMLHFSDSKSTKYALQALCLQFQLIELSPSLTHQLKWGRFVNYQGGTGKNIPCDLHNEHVNRCVKGIINNMGANLTEKAVRQAGQSVTMIGDIVSNFDKCSGVPSVSSAHSTRSDELDIQKVVSVVRENTLLIPAQGRCHVAFPEMSPNPLSHLKKKNILKWIVEKQWERIKWGGFRETQDDDDSSN